MTDSDRAFRTRATALRLLLFDVDGVLTDGAILLHPDGSELRRFHLQDGAALVMARRAGLLVGLITGRRSPTTRLRALELGIPIVIEGAGDKLSAYRLILADHGLRDDQVAYMGDDLQDLPVLGRVGLSAAPADAATDVVDRVHWVSARQGGAGAVREWVERILRAREDWAPIVSSFVEDAEGS